MTHDDHAAAALRERFAAAAPTITVDPAEIVRRGRRRRRATRLTGALAAVALVAVTAVGLSGLVGDGAGRVADGPPPAPPSEVSLWLSADRVPPGAELAAVLVNRSTQDVTFGILAEVERWDGQAWERHGQLPMCVGDWGCSAEMIGPDDMVDILDIGLSPTRTQPGPIERFTTTGMEPGWYRVTHVSVDGVEASGVLEITADAEQPAPLPTLGEAAITVEPAVVLPTPTSVRIHPQVPVGPDGSQTTEDLAAAVADLADVAQVERWQDGTWLPVVEVEIGVLPLADVTDPVRLVELPELSEGGYRLVRESSTGAPHVGSFWVSAAAGAIVAEAETQAEGTGGPGPGDSGPCGMDQVACALNQWLLKMIEGTGNLSLGGDHSIAEGSQILATPDGTEVWLHAEAAGSVLIPTAEIEPSRTAQVGEVSVLHGTSPDGARMSRLTCGGFVIDVAGVAGQADVSELAEALAAQVGPCPADAAALIESWADFLAGRTG